ncbi:hypothetical protein J2S74_004896 [Evansella vedderi]|uniref:Uncharacterized protein n=1 Tax=Evansella vedderi TaxID=38282 RepID=A0ABU0A427_9BACI|nr:hypothetical protein [Evansella vedderi]MDQ0257438.1 hypothetical protein [Evansella vedderi]
MNDNEKRYNSAAVTTADWYQREKHVISLRSPHRPHHFNTIDIAFRQTKFPEQCDPN